jgi:hypothetical protein
MKYGSIIIVKKSLINILLGFVKNQFHIKLIIWCYITYWVTRDNLEWNSIWAVQFSTIIVNQFIHIFELEKFAIKSGCSFNKNNYIDVLKIKLLICNQLLIAILIKFIIFYRCTKKRLLSLTIHAIPLFNWRFVSKSIIGSRV